MLEDSTEGKHVIAGIRLQYKIKTYVLQVLIQKLISVDGWLAQDQEVGSFVCHEHYHMEFKVGG